MRVEIAVDDSAEDGAEAEPAKSRKNAAEKILQPIERRQMKKIAGMNGHIAKLWIVICYSVSAMDIFRNSVGEIPFIF